MYKLSLTFDGTFSCIFFRFLRKTLDIENLLLNAFFLLQITVKYEKKNLGKNTRVMAIFSLIALLRPVIASQACGGGVICAVHVKDALNPFTLSRPQHQR